MAPREMLTKFKKGIFERPGGVMARGKFTIAIPWNRVLWNNARVHNSQLKISGCGNNSYAYTTQNGTRYRKEK